MILILCRFLFFFQDPGETNGLMPVVERMREIGADVEIGRPDEVDCEVFISGVATELQGDLYDVCRRQGIKTVAFWDNFQEEGQSPYFARAHRIEKKADYLWVPQNGMFAKREHVFVSGHPSLEVWKKQAAQVDKEAVRKRLGLGPKVAVWIGGYGAEYEKAYEAFKNYKHDYEVIYQPHPKTGIAPLISTVEAVVLADVVFCHQSTVAYQAAYLGKPVFSSGMVPLDTPEDSIERCVEWLSTQME